MDYWVTALIALLCLGIGILIGMYVGVERMAKAIEAGSVGNLRIDRSESDEAPMAFWEITGASIDAVSRMDFVILKVINENYLSRD